MDAKFDIFRRLPDGQPIWVKAVHGMEQAKEEILQLAAKYPGNYFIFDTRNGNMILAEAQTAAASGKNHSIGVFD